MQKIPKRVKAMTKRSVSLSFVRRFSKGERGNVIVMATIALPIIFGMIGLGLDVGRVYYLGHDLQEVADAAALAGAKELDGNVDAITRATDAANNLLNNDPRWSDVARSGVQIASLDFYSAVSAGNDTITADATQA